MMEKPSAEPASPLMSTLWLTLLLLGVLLALPSCSRQAPPDAGGAGPADLDLTTTPRIKKQMQSQAAKLALSLMKETMTRQTGDPLTGEAYLQESVDSFIASMKEQDKRERAFTAEMLRQITGEKLGDSYEEWKTWHDARQKETAPKTPRARAERLLRLVGTTRYSPLDAVEELAEIGEPALDPLIEGLRGPNRNIRATASMALGRIGGPRAEEALLWALMNENAGLRRHASFALARSTDTKKVLGLTRFFADKALRGRAALGLMEFNNCKRLGPPALEPMLEALKNEDRFVRLCAISILQSLRDSKVLDALLGALGDRDAEVRMKAIWAMEGRKDKRTVGPLIDALRDDSPGVVSSATQALCQITGKNFGLSYEAWKNWFDKKGD
jgi:HEAT repeat protein